MEGMGTNNSQRATGDFWQKPPGEPFLFSKVRVWKDTHEQR